MLYLNVESSWKKEANTLELMVNKETKLRKQSHHMHYFQFKNQFSLVFYHFNAKKTKKQW